MSESKANLSPGESSNLGDPARLNLLHGMFCLAHGEIERRSTDATQVSAEQVSAEQVAQSSAAEESEGAVVEATQLTGALSEHMTQLDDLELEKLHTQLGQSLLREIDRRMAGHGTPPGERPDLSRLAPDKPSHPSAAGNGAPRVGLVSLPWMSPALPSIQLATLASALARDDIESDVHELYVDYATRIGLNLYSQIGNLLGFLPEWIFSRHYYGPEHGDNLSAMIEQQPLLEFQWPELAEPMLQALEPVTRQYLDHMVEEVDWSQYDVLGCSLTISQLGASMAFARRVKLAHPSVQIIFGGSQCAGPMGRAILRICPYVDVVVHVEGEVVLPELVRRLRADASLAGLAGISYRGADGDVASNTEIELYRPKDDKLPLDYDAYFHRLTRLGVLEKMNPWIPFESSRGCWYGQKVQCTFCGLHEIMEYRAWEAEPVLEELERLKAKYGVGRFYSMDLILPREYLRTLLPEIVRRGHDWMFFYEIKANMRRKELELLAAAGIRWVQPGIESLDIDLLRLMKKGVSPLQNILLLKWSQELGIFCGWNLLFGLPGETEASYLRMAELIPKLSHLRPPSGGGRFQLHRFSPYFDQPEQYGIRWTGAHPMFQYAFPVPKEDLDELVYLHEFVPENNTDELVDPSQVEDAVRAWRTAHLQGATLGITPRADGSSVIVDDRKFAESEVIHHLSAAETELYLFLDAGVGEKVLARKFLRAHAEAAEMLGGANGLEAALQQWIEDDLVLAIDGKFLALALQTQRVQATAEQRPQDAEGVPYVDAAAPANPAMSVDS